MPANFTKLILTCLSFIFFISGNSSFAQSQSTPAFPNAGQTQNTNITYEIIPASNGTWGYDIKMNGHLFIHQQNIPGAQGNDGFKSKKASEKVAKLIVQKIIKGEMPPTVTIDEIKKLKAI